MGNAFEIDIAAVRRAQREGACDQSIAGEHICADSMWQAPFVTSFPNSHTFPLSPRRRKPGCWRWLLHDTPTLEKQLTCARAQETHSSVCTRHTHAPGTCLKYILNDAIFSSHYYLSGAPGRPHADTARTRRVSRHVSCTSITGIACASCRPLECAEIARMNQHTDCGAARSRVMLYDMRPN